MKVYHNSQNLEFRNPFGAVPTEKNVFLSLKLSDLPEKVYLRCWFFEKEELYEMEKLENKTDIFYGVNIKMPTLPTLFWYYFIIKTNDNKTLYYSNNKKLGGKGSLTDFKTDNSFQITVYDKNFIVPYWFCNTVMYQIFPDRFNGKITENTPKRRPEYYFHKDWYEPLVNLPHPHEAGPALCDFYGGSFKGIEEKIPYLKELGVSVLYLNPIFEAYSNHRYDTGNYMKPDPILGGEEDFKSLCNKAHENGIKIILDGVFSHTGSDSIYFNKYSYYDTTSGAYNNPDSPYRNWFQWEEGEKYKSWWGCSNLPNVYEMEPSYVQYILTSPDSVVKKWLRLGADGFRLDVADELPDEFIFLLRREVKKEKADAVIIGEVWEDATTKESYGKKREYLLGFGLDSVMNYPFKDLFISFLLYYKSAEDFKSNIMNIIENYPLPSLYSLMNIVSTHDTMRIKSVLGEAEDNRNLCFEERQNFKLSPEKETLSLKRLRLIAFLQMTFLGVPSIYYGDEIGMQGLSDPFNRMPFNWRQIDVELLDYYKKLTSLRNSYQSLRTGAFDFLYSKEDVIFYKREIKNSTDAFGEKADNTSLICFLNRSEHEKIIDCSFLQDGKYISLLKNKCLDVKNLTIPPFSADVLIKTE